MKTEILGAAVVACVGLCSPALAASLTVTDVMGVWSSSTPAVNGIDSNQLRWGTPVGTMQSGYDFLSSPVPFTVDADEEFVIGTFSHENFPIIDTLLEAADLKVTFSLEGVADPIVSTFSFVHTETFNNDLVCADGGTNGVGVNANGCADLVTASLNLAQSEVFEIDGVSYVLDIFGFRKDGTRFTSFWTEENRSNEAELVAVFSTSIPPSPTAVPLPASGLMLLFAVFGLGARRFWRA